MTIKEAFFSSTETLKQKTRKEIRAWSWPLTIIQYLVGYLLPIYLTINTYYNGVAEEYQLSAIAYLIVGVILLLLYKKLKTKLSDWETNKRIKYILLTLVKLIPLVAIVFILYVIETNTTVFMELMNDIVYCFLAYLVIDYFVSPLQTELRIRDKIRLNTENGRIID